MRIASLAPSVTEMLRELGVGTDHIVACTSLCGLPKDERREKAVGTFSVLNEDKIAKAKPDLIITATLVQAKGAVRLREAGYDVLHLDPRRLIEIGENYSELSRKVGRKARGEEIMYEFMEELEKMETPSPSPSVGRDSPSGRGKKLKIYMEEWAIPLYVAGNWVPDLVKLAGMESVLIKPGEPSREISLEELLEVDPDVIIQHACLPPLMPESTETDRVKREKHREVMREKLMQRPGWEELRAVKNGRVFSLDDTPFNMPTTGVLRGVEMLREVVDKSKVNY